MADICTAMMSCILIKKYHWSIPKGPIDSKISSGNVLAPNRRQATVWTSDDPVQSRMYALIGFASKWLVLYASDLVCLAVCITMTS